MKGIIYLFTLFLSTGLQANCLKGNCFIGKGTYKFSNGSTFTGFFADGKPHGDGVIHYKNGDYYEGEFFRGLRQGKGKYVYKSGTTYIGGFKRDKFAGKGEAVFSNGMRYTGSWENNTFHGQGTLLYENKDTYQGAFYRGKRHGDGTLIKQNNEVIKGVWKNDRLVKKIMNRSTSRPSTRLPKKKVEYRPVSHSAANSQKNCNKAYCHKETGRFTYLDGSYYEGHFLNGKAEGTGTCYYANGDIYRGGWKDHSPNGEGLMTFANGKKYSAVWKEGKPVRQLYQKPNLDKYQPEKPTREADGKIDMYALIIGISSYNHMPALKYTDDDAYQLYAFLKSPEGGALTDNHITILIDEAATKNNIQVSMKDLFEKADKDDVVIMYYSGHGLQGRFLPIDFDGYNNSLSYEELHSLMDLSQAKNKLLIADACYSGSMEGEKGRIDLGLDKLYNSIDQSNGGSAVLMSSKAEEVSLEYSGLRQGVFSHFLMKGLHGWADDDKDEIVTISELYRYIYDNVRTYTGNRQTPVLTGHYDRKMPVAMVR